jgi:dinuclear metal center YbgI/SA1388 family protein
MITTVNHILDVLLRWAPQHLKADYDNVGLLVGDPQQAVNGVLTCLDITEAVVNEALQSNCNLIVAHHPLIFRKMSAVRTDDPTGRLVTDLVRNNISVIALHTNLDSAIDGVSYVLAEQLGLTDLQFLETERTDGGYGVIGNLPQSLSTPAFLDLCAKSLHTPIVRYSGNPSDIDRVAVCGGAGSFLIEAAISRGAQAFVTADLKYHDFFTHTSNFLLCDAGHYETEMPVSTRLKTYLDSHFPDLNIQVTECITNPVRYHITTES